MEALFSVGVFPIYCVVRVLLGCGEMRMSKMGKVPLFLGFSMVNCI